MASRTLVAHNLAIMNFYFRWAIVIGFAVLAFAGPLAWARSVSLQFAAMLEPDARAEMSAANTFGEGVDPFHRGSLSDFGMEVTSADMNRLAAAGLLWKYWWLLGLLVLGCSYGLFVVLGFDR
ncbi:MAG: hypothetical protein JWN70_457 [Planctomycetaceae bacterium]|nr:hypothetical protein [Planctomycetaceae bacterium]